MLIVCMYIHLLCSNRRCVAIRENVRMNKMIRR